MTVSSTDQEEVITIENQSPQQVVRKTTKQTEPLAKGGAPQEVYETKKTIIRINQVIWYILGVVEVLIIFRIILKMVGANSSMGFTNFIYSVTSPLAIPFSGVLGVTVSGTSLIEWSSVVAALVYLVVAWGFIYLIGLIYPISPKDVES